MKQALSFIATGFIALSGFAQTPQKTLIFSDIDDTIKVSHILSAAGAVSRGADVTTPFLGMAELYQHLIQQNPQNTRIVYLSNAPKQVAGIPALELAHRTFLSFNGFPPGEVDLRANIFEQNHKINELRRIIEQEKPDVVILFGDNGERDPNVYHQLFSEYAGKIKIASFIHQLYTYKLPFYKIRAISEVGSQIHPEQIGYVTPVEVAEELRNQGLLESGRADWMVANIAPQIADEARFKWDGLRPISFPSFKNCGDFVWKWKLRPALMPLYQKIMSRCR